MAVSDINIELEANSSGSEGKKMVVDQKMEDESPSPKALDKQK